MGEEERKRLGDLATERLSDGAKNLDFHSGNHALCDYSGSIFFSNNEKQVKRQLK